MKKKLVLALCSSDSTMSSEGLVYFITGGCGFLGQHLLTVLLEQEDRVKEIRLFDKRADPSLQDLSTGKTGLLISFCLPAWCIASVKLR